MTLRRGRFGGPSALPWPPARRTSRRPGRHPHACDRALRRAELRWCMFNGIRIEAARPDMRRGAKQARIAAFDEAVQEWNRGCRRYRCSRPDRDAVQRRIEARRAARSRRPGPFAAREAG